MRVALGFCLILSLSAVNVMAETPEEIPVPRDTSITRSILVPTPDNTVPPLPQPQEIVPTPLTETPSAQPTPAPQVLPAPQAKPAPRILSTPQVAPAPQVIQAPQAGPVPLVLPANNSALYDTAGELPGILQALATKRFLPDEGHSMAASLLANCATGLDAQTKADSMEAMYRAIIDRRFPVIVVSIQALGLRAMEPQISLLAATLVCKQGERSTVQTLDSLDSAFTELQRQPYGLTEFFHNLIVAANLMY